MVQTPVEPIAPDEEHAAHMDVAPGTGEEEKPFFVLEQMPEGRDDDHSAHKNADGHRSLQCKECGALNLPTEWYCEKCGAELSTF